MFDEVNGINSVLLAMIGCINIFTFSIYYVDKRRAIKRKYRISEKALLMSSFLFGGIGAWLGMTLFRHKTQQALFKYSLPVAAIITLGVIYLIVRQSISSFF
ncbi:DUF1294 domain-containing protein [Alkalibacterium sp. 20]|uniref:DUF1294 domain-containing protein n=1 Tax=Alkalibacterium sp. 20 TaxID=1798803 RepID=UPI0009001DD9|nr:DUF1294 domain-containing protein [Alkalibacterium sp. 20]OJF94155.1 hypothetical protein AX762_07950 [Alkalibacterium sp. 20]